MIRRYVNLVVENRSTRTYSLHRLDFAKHLFYPSTAEAEAANAANNVSDKPSRIGILRRLPPASMCFGQFTPPKDDTRRTWHPDDMFTLLSPSSSEGKILHISEEGPAVVYDADARSTNTVPSLHGCWGHNPPIFIPIAGDGEETDSLYMIRDSNQETRFRVLDFNQHPLEWQPLPPPPFTAAAAYDDQYYGFDGDECSIESVTVVDGGHTICVSTNRNMTFCFDTKSRKWWQVGHWSLPFGGRAEYVPELDIWMGFAIRSEANYQLCASSDLSAMTTHRAPKLQHVWEDLRPPKEQEDFVMSRRFMGAIVRRTKDWVLESHNLVNLGGGRFCVAKVFTEYRTVRIGFEGLENEQGPFLVLTGIEVIRGGGDDGEVGLRMVKHKSKLYPIDGIRWVL